MSLSINSSNNNHSMSTDGDTVVVSWVSSVYLLADRVNCSIGGHVAAVVAADLLHFSCNHTITQGDGTPLGAVSVLVDGIFDFAGNYLSQLSATTDSSFVIYGEVEGGCARVCRWWNLTPFGRLFSARLLLGCLRVRFVCLFVRSFACLACACGGASHVRPGPCAWNCVHVLPLRMELQITFLRTCRMCRLSRRTR